MKLFSRLRKQPKRARHDGRYRPSIEQLDLRCLLSVAGGASIVLPLIEVDPNDTLDTAQPLGDLGLTPRLEVRGLVGDGFSDSADVDWYRFTLEVATQVNLAITGSGASSQPILSLYNSNPDPYDFSDPFAISGHRLVQQTADHQAKGSFAQNLAPGTYYVAISGGGNRFFHPFLADSGYAGVGGAYRLAVNAVPQTQNEGDGPVVLATDPLPNGTLATSPFVVRIGFNAPLDPNTLNPGGNVRLIYNATGTFGDGNDLDIYLASYNYSLGLMELQLTPAAPLAPGFYQIFLQGDATFGDFVLTDLNGVSLGADEAHPFGQDFTSSFQVTGIEGQTSADDSAPFAHELGELGSPSVIQLVGAIGDDPYYDVNNPDQAVNPSSDVDMYHFHISGPGRFSFSAEVFAGRFGSPADVGICLFRRDPATGQFVFVGGNNNSRNLSHAANDTVPLFLDPALFVGLTEGDYYVAVTSNYNTPTSVAGFEPGNNGIFDPHGSHSGTAGFSVGPYVLNLRVQADDTAPIVVATTPAAGETLNAPPTMIVVQFSEAMNLQSMFFNAFEENSANTIAAVFVQGADGVRYFPRLASYDSVTNTATFLMLDGLANGDYTLHFSGSMGLTDMAGHPLTGNDLSSDFLVFFSLDGSPRGTNGDSHQWSAAEPNDSPQQPQDLGVLFPQELEDGVVVMRDAGPGQSDTADYFKFEVLQTQKYSVELTGVDSLDALGAIFTDLDGNPLSRLSLRGLFSTMVLHPGIYLLRVDGWTADRAAQVVYRLKLQIVGNSDNAPALTVGAAPALQLRLAGTEAATALMSPQVFVAPGSDQGVTPPQENRIFLVSFPPISNASPSVRVSVNTGVTLPSGTLLQLTSTPLGSLATARDVGTLDAANQLPSVLPETSAGIEVVPSFLPAVSSTAELSWWNGWMPSLAQAAPAHSPEAIQNEILLQPNSESTLSNADVTMASAPALSGLARAGLWLASLMAVAGAMLVKRSEKRVVSVVPGRLLAAKSVGEAERAETS